MTAPNPESVTSVRRLEPVIILQVHRDESGAWIASSREYPGITAEAPSLTELRKKLPEAIQAATGEQDAKFELEFV